MILTPRIILRLVLVALTAVLVQRAFFSELLIAGTQPDIIPVVVVCLGLLGGSMLGAGSGFALGLVVDLLTYQILGLSSLVLIGVGYLAGRIRETTDIRANSLIPPLVAGGLTALAVAGFAVLQFMLGVDSPVSLLILRDLVVKAILNVFIAVPMFLAIRRLVAPALIDDVPARRGRRNRSRPLVGLG
ncbi:MAG: rod shape-determining protein MreD [Solirubrobacterales bacterium]